MITLSNQKQLGEENVWLILPGHILSLIDAWAGAQAGAKTKTIKGVV